jgi:NAD+ kinase
MAKSIGLALKDSKDALELAEKVRGYLEKKGVDVVLEEYWAAELNARGLSLEDMDVDVLVALGGDGTILRVLNYLPEGIPILGVNLGTEGYLVKVKPGDWRNALEKVIAGDVKISEHVRIDVVVGGKIVGSALNEAVVSPSEPVKMLNFEVYVDDCLFFSSRADGIIVATPVGSTAYSLSAGGSIIDLRVPAFIVTPICPFDRVARPVVVPQSAVIKVRIVKTRREAIVVFDGEYKKEIDPAEEVTFRLSKKKALFVDV